MAHGVSLQKQALACALMVRESQRIALLKAEGKLWLLCRRVKYERSQRNCREAECPFVRERSMDATDPLIARARQLTQAGQALSCLRVICVKSGIHF
jgi:hypothetical protein